MPSKIIYTIGYSSFDIDQFLKTIKSYDIKAVIDVRSYPYSKIHTEFNREKLKGRLSDELIYYVFLGDKCGARVEDLSCYADGHVDFKKVAGLPEFQAGLARILEGARQFPIALMCAEKDPITCHRTILICKELYKHNVEIKHILQDGRTEDHSELEKRLLKLFNLDQHHLLKSKKDSLDEAYERQGKKISYRRHDDEQIYELKEI